MAKKKSIYPIALIDNNVLDKSMYITNQSYWEITETPISNKKESYVLVRAEKSFINKFTGEEARQIIEVKNRLPNHQDNAILFTLISLAQEQNSYEVKTTIYKILEILNWSKNEKNYNIIRNSIDLWYSMNIEYINCFYTHDSGYINLKSRVITYISEIPREGKLHIKFESEIYKQLIQNKFFTGIYIHNYARLKSGFQRRLYEILSKSFSNSLTWEIRWENLLYKLEDDSRYKSYFLRKLKRAIDSINQKTDLKISLDLINENLLQFRLLNKERVHFMQLIDYLENTKDKYRIDNDFILKFKHKCYLKNIDGSENFILICKDDQLKSIINENKLLKRIIYASKINAIL